jgi:hypothetical protein
MERMLLATGTLSDAAIITGPTGAGDLTIDNLKRQSLQEPYRIIGNSAVIDIDLLNAVPVNVIALIGHNGSAGGTVQVTASNTFGGYAYNSGVLPFVTGPKQFDKSLFFLFTDQTFRYWRITITDNQDYIEIGRLYISNAFQPSYNMIWGFQQGFTDASQEYETISGDSISLKRKKKRFAELSLEDLSEDEVFAELYPLDKMIGTSGDVLFIPKPDEITHLQFNAIYGKIEALQPNALTAYNRFSRQFRIKELLP